MLGRRRIGQEHMTRGPIFVGYRSQDQRWAVGLHERLESAGVTAFLDRRSIGPGQRWTREFERSLATAEVFVALLSGAAGSDAGTGDGHYFDHEVQTAIERYRRLGRPIVVPVYVDVDRPPIELPYGLRPFQGLFLGDGDWSKVVDPLVSLVADAPAGDAVALDAQLARLKLRLAHAYASQADASRLEAELNAVAAAQVEKGTLHRGRIIDARYQLVGETARDSLCSTWTALDIYLAEFVSLRVYTAERLKDAQAKDWSERSAERWARLRHRGIARLKDRLRIEPASGLGYLCLEAGDCTLRKGIDDGRITAVELIDTLRPLAEALDLTATTTNAHLRVNPQTIMLTADGRPKLTGFSPPATSRAAVMRHLTAEELRYMAPEIVWMAESALTARVDQYALAMVTVAILHGAPLDVGVIRDTAGFVSRLEGAGRQTQTCLLQALDTDPDRRFSSCIAFVDALEQARIADDLEQIGDWLVSADEYGWLIAPQLRRLRCAGLPVFLVAKVPDDARPRSALELEIDMLRRTVSLTAEADESADEGAESAADEGETSRPASSSVFAQWLRNVRLLLGAPSPLTRKLDSALAVLDRHRPARPLCRQLDHRFGRVLDLLLAHEPDDAVEDLRAVWDKGRYSLVADGTPRLKAFSDFVDLADVAVTPDGRELLNRWLDRLVRRVPSMIDWVDDTREALGQAATADALVVAAGDRSMISSEAVLAATSMDRYRQQRRLLLQGIPPGYLTRLRRLDNAWDQTQADVSALWEVPGGLHIWLTNAMQLARTDVLADGRWARLSRLREAVGENDGPPADAAEPALTVELLESMKRAGPGWQVGSPDWLNAVAEVVSLVFVDDDLHAYRTQAFWGISPWAASWLGTAGDMFSQVLKDGQALFELGWEIGGYLERWLSNVLEVWAYRAGTEIEVLRVAHEQVRRARTTPQWSADVRPPETHGVEQRLAAAGLDRVLVTAVEHGLFSRRDRTLLLLDISRSTVHKLPFRARPLEQLASDLSGLASRATTGSARDLAMWLTRAEQLTDGSRNSRVFTDVRDSLGDLR